MHLARFAMKGGQVQEPKLTTSGSPTVATLSILESGFQGKYMVYSFEVDLFLPFPTFPTLPTLPTLNTFQFFTTFPTIPVYQKIYIFCVVCSRDFQKHISLRGQRH